MIDVGTDPGEREAKESGEVSTPSRQPPAEVAIPPCWRIVRPGHGEEGGGVRVVLAPGPGFGSGTHESTQLCLQAIAAIARQFGRPFRMLDFGSGSGILSLGAAKLGGTATGVEIDPRAIEHAEENARRNDVSEQVQFAHTLEGAPGPFDLVVANILRSVLLAFAGDLAARLDPAGTLVLAGLVSTDVPEVAARYTPLLGRGAPEIYQLGEWRALLWRPATPPP